MCSSGSPETGSTRSASRRCRRARARHRGIPLSDESSNDSRCLPSPFDGSRDDEPDRPKWTTGREHRLTSPDDSLPDGSLPGDVSSRCSRPNRNRSAHHGRSDPAAEQIRADYFSVRKKCAVARRGSDDPRSARQPSDFTASEAENMRPGSRPSKYPPSDSASPAALHSAPGASNRCSTRGAAMSATIGPYTTKT